MRLPQRGEVWVVDLGMAAKVRPGVVISVPPGNLDRVLVTIVPHTTAVRGSSFEVAVPVPFLQAGAFNAQGLVTIPAVHASRMLGRLGSTEMAAIEQVVMRWLGLNRGGA